MTAANFTSRSAGTLLPGDVIYVLGETFTLTRVEQSGGRVYAHSDGVTHTYYSIHSLVNTERRPL